MKLFKVAVATIAVLLAALVIGEAQISIPYSFTTGTTISSSQVNANFSALGAAACNLTGCTMQGILTSLGIVPASTATYDIGSSSAKYANLFLSGTTSLNSQTYTWPATQVASGTLQTNGSGALAWAPLQMAPCGLRLTLTSGTPVTTADVTGASAVNVYVTPFSGGVCAFYDGSASWTAIAASEVTVAVPATTSTMYDIFCYNSSGSMACEALAWTNDTTRATALTTQNNVYVKTGATTRRYIGSFRTTTVSGQTEDSAAKRLVWSYYNRVRRPLARLESTASWTYTTNAYRQANGSTTNQVAAVIGVAETAIDLRVSACGTNNTATPGTAAAVAIGLDGIASFVPNQIVGITQFITAINGYTAASASFVPTAGYHFYTWLEISGAIGTTTWYGAGGATYFQQSGLNGFLEG